MSVLVGKLNALYPDLNLTIDENTGSLSENTEKLLENIEAQKQAAIDTAFDERKTELLQQQADVEVELATNRATLNDLREQENALTEENNSLNERNAEIYDELATLGDDDLARRAELESELYSNNEAINANAEAAADLRDQQQTVNDAIDEGTEASGELYGAERRSLSGTRGGNCRTAGGAAKGCSLGRAGIRCLCVALQRNGSQGGRKH